MIEPDRQGGGGERERVRGTFGSMSERRRGVILIMGLRGAGKTTLGRSLSQRLGREFVDLDSVTLERLGCSTVAQAWGERGEPAFRISEREALASVLERGAGGADLVVSLGGGTPTAPGCEAMIREAIGAGRASVVYLRGDPAMLAERVRRDPPAHRPRLLGLGEDEARQEMERVYALRDPLYRSLATHVVDARGRREDVLNAVAALFE